MHSRLFAVTALAAFTPVLLYTATDTTTATAHTQPQAFSAVNHMASADNVSLSATPTPGAEVHYSAATRDFSAAGLTWVGDPEAELHASLRTRVDDGQWGPWGALHHGESGPGRSGTSLAWTGHRNSVELNITLVGGNVQDLRLHLINPSQDGTGNTPKSAPVPEPANESAAQTSMPLAVHNRSQWQADEGQMTWAPEYADSVKAVTVHHTATRNEYSAEEVPAILRSIYRYQAVEQEWGDIGYNILVDKFGRAWEGRAGGIESAVVGAHAGGFNTGTAGVALIGDTTSEMPSAEAKETIARFIAYKLQPNSIDPRGTVQLTGGPSTSYPAGSTVELPRVFGHNATSATACPGYGLDIHLDQLRNRAAELGSQVSLAPPA